MSTPKSSGAKLEEKALASAQVHCKKCYILCVPCTECRCCDHCDFREKVYNGGMGGPKPLEPKFVRKCGAEGAYYGRIGQLKRLEFFAP